MKGKTKQGFTLIELLAVIVILAVIALIATPLIMNVINDAKRGAARDAGYNVIKAGELAASSSEQNPPFYYDESSNLSMKGTKPTSFILDINEEMDTQLRAWINGFCVVKEYENETVTVDESKKTETDCTNASRIEKPVIQDGMIPVTFDNDGNVMKADIKSSWYDYDNKKWANAVSVTNDSRVKYKSASAGTKIEEADILGYFVWVPRYKYQLWNAEGGQASKQEIKIEFERKYAKKSVGKTNGEWLTHPAFTFGSTELAGLWIGKFELTGNSTTPTVKPNVKAIVDLNIKTMFDTIRKFSETSNYGLSSYDAHMMKNSEWGAVTYLSHSKYGKNSEVWINNNSNYTTGCGGNSTGEAQTSMCKNAYGSKENGVYNQSTTGNITGIFDMSGGVYERVMASVVNEDGSLISANSGFTEKPDAKYYDEYAYNTSDTNFNISKLGDAIREAKQETSGNNQNWYGDTTYIPNSTNPWFERGGAASYGAVCGLFNVYNTQGYGYSHVGGRTVVVAE